ncbi:MAG TPA: quinone-dependent dihydroorotate dehydrogenase [Candidatus Thalassarchaeaceae archaeon]|nr:quinone-dependent dihydroorotate dehydrogenase [Candidatus Thalassarchaeaceae archaeon]HJO84304.1 quinone-dependent dihydroorotate dehydrogenase [Candidatus Thalassarchaeaceae archaeon]|tara:strand:+ start:13528 stop:14631 length:1104 start_codon:yes stop_codon:yes gene_type:complete
MGLAWRMLANPSLKLIDPERAHSHTISFLSSIGEKTSGQFLLNQFYRSPKLPIEVFDLLFHHPLGLAAGFDKGAEALLSWPALGFSWSEYGGVTRYPQDGNPKPRMFRANKDRALVNNMGLNNPGASVVRDRLIARKVAERWPKSPVAANIGRSMKVDDEHVADDYSSTLDVLWDYADLFVLNISSPNTPGLRDLHEEDLLEGVLRSCIGIGRRKQASKPILLKLSPDSPNEEALDTARVAMGLGIDGFVATNTTVSRPIPLSTQSRKALAHDGGLSGRPLHGRTIEIIEMLFQETEGKVPIIGVGGIESCETAWNAITSGASLLQLYSSLVFNGPSIVSNIVRGLAKKTKESGFSGISEAVGYKHI